MKKLLLPFLLGIASFGSVFSYEATPQDDVLIDHLSGLFDDLDTTQLTQMRTYFETLDARFEKESKKGWYVEELSEVIEEILIDRFLKEISDKKQQEKKEERVEPLAPKRGNMPTISDTDFTTLMNHIPVSVADHEIVLIEFTDLECPFCQRFEKAQTLQQLDDEYGAVGHVSLAFPLSFHAQAQPAAEAMNCVYKEAGYDAYVQYKKDVMDTGLRTGDDVTDVVYESGYTDGITNAVLACLSNGDAKKAVAQQMALGKTLGVNGTPATIVLHMPTKRYTKVSGAVQKSAFIEVLDAMLASDRSYFDASSPAPTLPGGGGGIVVDPTAYETFLAGAYVIGNPDAAVTVIEFSDVECSYCQRHSNNGTLDAVQESYAEEVNTIFAHFPLGFHAHAQEAAEALECAGKLGGDEGFAAFKEAYFALGGNANLDNAKIAAEQVGLDEDALLACVESGEFEQKVKDHMDFGRSLGVTGTPGNIVIDNETGKTVKISGAVPASSFDTAIQGFLAE